MRLRLNPAAPGATVYRNGVEFACAFGEEVVVTVHPGKECGTCNACCNYPGIDTAEFRKLPSVLCENYANHRCGIYETRPTACRDFYCGWMLSSLGEEWRPDKSEILIVMEGEAPGRQGGLKFMLLALDRIFWEPFVTHISTLIMQGQPVHLLVPGKAGETCGATRLNDSNLLRQAIGKRDFASTTAVLSQAVQACIAQPREKVKFNSGPADADRTGTT
jgi:hypothetical protein